MTHIFYKSATLFLATIFFSSCKKDPIEHPSKITDESANYTVSTFAGKGENGIDPATGNPAMLSNPAGMAFDSKGNLYVIDGDNDKIRKISPSGSMTTFAGSIRGYADGPAATAQFGYPLIIAFDSKDNAYVSETLNPRIRKITPGGIVSTIAGNGTEGHTDGPALSAQVGVILGMAADGNDNLFFSQYYFYGVRKLTSSGEVNTFAGGSTEGFQEGSGINARFAQPGSIAKDSQGNLYVTDSRNSRIRKITPGGMVSTAFQSQDGIAFVSIDGEGNIYFLDNNQNNPQILKVSPGGTITIICHTPFGTGRDGAGNTATFGSIQWMALSPAGELYVSELSGLIRKIKKN